MILKSTSQELKNNLFYIFERFKLINIFSKILKY